MSTRPPIDRLSARRGGAVALLLAAAATSVAGAADDPCEPSHQHEQPAAGHWTGAFKLAYQLDIPGLPPSMNITINWEGALDFELGRTEEDDSRTKPPPPLPQLRRPLRPPGSTPPPPIGPSDRAAPGQFKNNEEQIAAYWEAYNTREERNREQVEAILKWYAEHLPPSHLYVGPGENAKIKGTAKSNVQTPVRGTIGDAKMSGAGRSTEPLHHELKGEERDPTAGFTEIEMLGEIGKNPFSFGGQITRPDARATVDAHVDQAGRMKGRATGTGGGKTVSRDFAKDLERPVAGGKQKVAGLLVDAEQSHCWYMGGSLDPSVIREMVRGGGAGVDIRIVTSEWSATLDERDEAFEKQVEALAAEPIPRELSWDYIDSFKSRWVALRGDSRLMSDYKRCVLKQLETKFVRINLAALQVYVNNFPKASENATCSVMHAALARILPIQRLLQLYGMGECPLVTKVNEVASKEMQELLKQTLARKHSLSDLECFIGAYKSGMLDFGDQAAAFEQALTEYMQAAADRR